MNIVKRFLYLDRLPVPTATTTTPLPSSTTSMYPGNYLFNGVGYDFTAPGLYRCWAGNATPIQSRIVYGGDLFALLSAISNHHRHGVADEVLAPNWQSLWTAGRTSKWELRCGFLAGLATWFLPLWNYEVRLIGLLTLDPTNGVDDGHTVFEVFHQGKWQLIDLTRGCYFTFNNIVLSAEEITNIGVTNCTRVPLSPNKFNVIATTPDGFDMGAYEDLTMFLPEEEEAWFTRIYQSWWAIT